MDDSPATANSSALSHRDFRRYLSAAFLAILAMQIQSVAVSWQVYGIARTPLALGYVGLFQFLPMMACTIPAGHMADRFDRRLILVISNFCSAIAAGGFLMLALTRTTVIWPFYAVLVIFGASRAFAGPASQSLVPLLVPQDQFPQAVAWASSTSQVAVIAGPAIGGAIYILGPAVDYGVCLIAVRDDRNRNDGDPEPRHALRGGGRHDSVRAHHGGDCVRVAQAAHPRRVLAGFIRGAARRSDCIAAGICARHSARRTARAGCIAQRAGTWSCDAWVGARTAGAAAPRGTRDVRVRRDFRRCDDRLRLVGELRAVDGRAVRARRARTW